MQRWLEQVVVGVVMEEDDTYKAGSRAVAALAVAREGRSLVLGATVRCSCEEDLAPELEVD